MREALAALVSGVVLLLGAGRLAGAATFTVDSTADAVDAVLDGTCASAAGACTLRAAVQEANATAGPDTIVLPAGTYLLTIAGTGEDRAATGDLDVIDDLTITGAGAATTLIDGNSIDRVLDVIGTAALAVSGVTVQNGSAAQGGGLHAVTGTLSLTDVVVRGNHASVGGGLFAGNATLTRCTVSGNSTEITGGGIASTTGTMTIDHTTISGNTGTLYLGGGGVATTGDAVLTVRDTTISGNGIGGLLNLAYCNPPPFVSCFDGSTVTLNNVTIADTLDHFNPFGLFGSTTVANSIVRQCTGAVFSHGHNVVQIGSCGGDPSDRGGGDPRLGPLQDNGGPTATRAILPGSPAIDSGNPAVPGSGGDACEADDQRGVARPFGAACDSGAFEATCGNGVVDPGEECDDGNRVDGDGCDSNCTRTACGNGILTAGEDCDDGNLTAGDCCSPACRFESAGTTCAADGNFCTDDVCDGTGRCTHPNNTLSCDVLDPCSSGNRCTNGVCTGGHGCDPCLTCFAGVGCRIPPDVCQAAAPGGASLALRSSADDAKDGLGSRWTSSGTGDVADFGMPDLGTDFRMCVYDAQEHAVLSAIAGGDGTCGRRDCWRRTATGWVFRNTGRTPIGGITRVLLRAGGPGKARIDVVGRGPDLHLATPPLTTPVRARLVRGFGPPCWEATFAGGAVQRNQPTGFRARD